MASQLSHPTTPWLLHKGMRCTIDRSLEVSPVAMNRDGFSGFPFFFIFHGIFGLSIDHPGVLGYSQPLGNIHLLGMGHFTHPDGTLESLV